MPFIIGQREVRGWGALREDRKEGREKRGERDMPPLCSTFKCSSIKS